MLTISASTAEIDPLILNGEALEEIRVEDGSPTYTSVEGVLFDREGTTLLRYPRARKGDFYAIPRTVTAIAPKAFEATLELAAVAFPAGLRSIGNEAFAGSGALREVRVPAVQFMGEGVFFACHALLKAELADGIVRVEDRLFAACSKLREVAFPASVTQIGKEAFFGCGFETLRLPDGIRSVGPLAFDSNHRLKTLILPAGLTQVGDSAFSECDPLAAVYFEGTAPAGLDRRTFAYSGDALVLYHGAGAEGFDGLGYRTAVYKPLTSAPARPTAPTLPTGADASSKIGETAAPPDSTDVRADEEQPRQNAAGVQGEIRQADVPAGGDAGGEPRGGSLLWLYLVLAAAGTTGGVLLIVCIVHRRRKPASVKESS